MDKLDEKQLDAISDALLGPQQAKLDAEKKRQRDAAARLRAQRKWALPGLGVILAISLFNSAPAVSAVLLLFTLILVLWQYFSSAGSKEET
ncbi:hypothetical protein [Alkalimonas amylolytica]|uniref:DUF3040 domain-containing protein n=1 Tax=Alkalimonas amylolytica TaxID=152573 RepID=A0A1H4FV69_ALKAM|nr:hypothetical protein [Alkalimonas amylolytica]SEB01041.1 hypothetical protein SAMN04488051_11356 [Alkalimonas amylolytica]